MSKVYGIDFNGNSLWVADIDPQNILTKSTVLKRNQLMLGGNLNNPSSIFIDEKNKRIYWTNLYRNELWTGCIVGPNTPNTPTEMTLLLRDDKLAQPSGLFVDSANERIYWSNFADNTIWVAEIDFSGDTPAIKNPKLLISGNNLAQPSGLFVDCTNKKIYWANYGNNTLWVADIFNLRNPKDIMNQKVLMANTPNLNKPSSIFVDNVNNVLYWTNAGNNTMRVKKFYPDNPHVPTPNSSAINFDANCNGNLITPFGLFITDATILTECKILIKQISTDPVPKCAGRPFVITWSVDVTGGLDTHNAKITFNGQTFNIDASNQGGTITLMAPNTNGNYPLTLTVQDKDRPDRTDTKAITIFVQKIEVSAGSNVEINYGQTVQLGQGAPLANIQYSWTPTTGIDNPNILNTTAQPAQTTTYTVTAKSTQIPDCIASDSITISVCRLVLSDVICSYDPCVCTLFITGKHVGTKPGIRFIDLTYQGKIHRRMFDQDGTFTDRFTKITSVNTGDCVSVRIYYSDNTACCDEFKTNTIVNSKVVNTITFDPVLNK